MGALSGGMTVKRMLTSGPPMAKFRERFVDSLNAYAVRPLEPASDEDRVCGWAAVAHALDTRFESEKVFFNEYLCVAYRIDTLKVPATTLKLHQRDAELAWLAENHMETMPRGQRKELHEEIALRLRERMVPTIKAVDLVWNTTTGQVWVWTHSAKVLEEIEELFHKTFELELRTCDPYSVAERALEGPLAEALEQAEPAVLFDPDAVKGGAR